MVQSPKVEFGCEDLNQEKREGFDLTYHLFGCDDYIKGFT